MSEAYWEQLNQHDAMEFLVYSNIWISLEAVSVAVVTMVLVGTPIKILPAFVSFAIFFLIYNVDRFTDADEDAEDMPRRTDFVRKYGGICVGASIVLYAAALLGSFGANPITFLFTVIPVGLGAVYSPLNLKDILFVKNAVVGIAWGTVPLLVGAYFGALFEFEVLFLWLFFTLSFFRSAMIFDIKDIEGDLREGVKTIPNTFGIDTTKRIAYLVDVTSVAIEILLVVSGYLSPLFLVLLPFHLYIVAYVWSLDRESGEMFYSVIIDGECIFLGVLVVLIRSIGI